MPSLSQYKPWPQVEQWLRSQGTPDDEINRQKKLYWKATSQTDEMRAMPVEKLTSLQNNFLGTGEPGFLGTMWNAAKRGHLQAQLARQGTKAYIASIGKDEPQNAMDLIGPIADIAGTYKELERLPTPEVTKHVEQAKGLGDWLNAVKEDPANFLGDSIVSMLVNFAETAGPIAALTTAAGGALGSVIGPEGTVGGAALGARIGASLGVGAADLATVGTERFFNAFAQEGVDITDPDSLRAALGNPEMVKKARDHALRAALPMAAFDALSAGLAGKLVGIAKTPIARTLAAGAETFGMHPALGVTGMAAGQQLSEGKINPGQLATAAVGQIGIGGLMTGLGSIKPDTNFAVYRKAFDATDKSLPFEARRQIAVEAVKTKKFPEFVKEHGAEVEVVPDAETAAVQVAAEQNAGQIPRRLLIPDFLKMLDDEMKAVEVSPDAVAPRASKSRDMFASEKRQRWIEELRNKPTDESAPWFGGRTPSDAELIQYHMNRSGKDGETVEPQVAQAPEDRMAGAFQRLLSDEHAGVATPEEFTAAVRKKMEEAPVIGSEKNKEAWAIRQIIREGVLPPERPARDYDTLERVHREESAKGFAIRASKRVAQTFKPWTKEGLKNLGDVFKRGLFNSDAQMYEWYNFLRKVGIKPENDPVMALQVNQFADSVTAAHANEMNMQLRPLLESTGMDPEQISFLVKANRIGKGDRQILAHNPLTLEEAQVVHNGLTERFGADKIATVEKAWADFGQGPRLALFKFADENGLLSDEMRPVLEDPSTLEFYAKFNVIEKMAEGGGGIDSAKILEQIGTLKEVEDPIHATLMKDTAFIKAILKAKAAKSLIEFCDDFIGPDAAVPAPKDARGNFRQPPAGAKLRLIKFMQKNDTVGYWVPEGMSKTLADAPQEVTAWSKIYRALHDPIRKVFVDWNPGFAIYNPVKDTGSSYKNIVRGDPVTGAAQLAYSMVKKFPEAWRTAWSQKVGPKDVDTLKLMKEGAIIPPTRRQYEAGDVAETGPIGDNWYKNMQSITSSDSAHLSMRKRLLAWSDRMLSGPGAVGERLVKLASFDYMRRLQKKYKWTDEEMYHAIRNYAGTPNPMVRGDWNKITNSLFLFSNIRKNGYASSWRAYQDNPFSFITKTMMFDVAPTMLKIAAAHGLLNKVTGDKLDEFHRKISEYDKENYNIHPIGLTKSGKAVYSAIPHDHVGQSLAKELWRAAKDPVNLKNILDVVWNEFPYTLSTSALHPVIHATMDTSEYLQGRNPYDSYRGQPVIPDKIFDAGGMDSAAYFWKHIAQTLTGGVLIQFSSDNQSDVLDELEARLNGQPYVQGEVSKAKAAAIQFGIDHQRTPILSNIVRRFIRVSNYGESQFAKEAVAGTNQREAAVKRDREKIIKAMLAADPEVTSYAIMNELKRRKIPITNRSSLVKTIQRLRTRIYSASMKDKAKTYGGSKAQQQIVGRMK